MTAGDNQREFAITVVRRLQAAGFQALWAGGCVRDLLLNETPGDYDVATDARPEQVQNLFGPRKTLAIGASFGVIQVRGPQRGCDVEVATFRTEGPYGDGRRPDHVRFSSPEEDAQRRDFTINGMFYDPLIEQVFDYVGGRDDLARGIVKAIGEPRARFQEDKLRMLRAVRLAARFNFRLDGATARAATEMAGEILVVSRERITQELKKMLVHERRSQALELARQLKLALPILPELAELFTNSDPETATARWRGTLRRVDRLHAPSFELALATLLYDLTPGIAEPKPHHGAATLSSHRETAALHALGRRMRLANHETELITWLTLHRRALVDAPTLALSQLKRLAAHPAFVELIKLHRAAAEADHCDLAPVDFCEEFLQRTPPEEIAPPPLLTGADLIGHGLQPGAQFSELLTRVRDAQLEGTIATVGEALALVDQIVGGQTE